MLFLCFAVKDRMPLINDINQYFVNFGIDTWYDRRNIYLGNKRHEENIEHGAKNPNIKYAVVFYSENFANGNICLDEYDILVQRHKKGEVYIFPVFLQSVPKNLAPRFNILTELVYKLVCSPDDYLGLTLHIVAKMTQDIVSSLRFNTLKDYMSACDKDSLFYHLLREYEAIDKKKYAMRIAYLFGMYKMLTYKKQSDYLFFKSMHYLFYSACYNTVKEEKRELQVMENILLAETIHFFPIP